MPYPHEVTLAKANTAVRESNFPTAALLFYQATVEGSLEAQKVFDGESSARFQTNPHAHREIKADDETGVDNILPTALQYLMGLGVIRNDQRAFELLSQWAEQNAGRDFSSESAEEKTARANVYYVLGCLYFKGRWVAQNNVKTAEWFENAANSGHVTAMNNVGWLCAEGLWVAQDYAKAHEYYEKAANCGDTVAMNNLGLLYHEGRGVAQDDAKAVGYYEKAANLGDAEAMFNVGCLYLEGRGVTGGACVRNQLRALYWYNRSNKHRPNREEHVDLTQTCKNMMQGKSRTFALALLEKNPPSNDDNPSLEDAIKSILLDENETEKNKTAVVEQLCEEITKGRWSFASPAVQATLTGLFNPNDEDYCFYSVLNHKQRSELLMTLIVQRHRDNHFLQPSVLANTEIKRESTSEGSSTVMSDEELLKALALLIFTRGFFQADDHLCNEAMCIVLSLLQFPKNDQGDPIDRCSLFLPFIQNLTVLQICLNRDNKILLVAKVFEYMGDTQNNVWKMLGSDSNSDKIDSYFKSEDYSALHQAALAKVEKAMHPELDTEEQGEDFSKITFFNRK